MKKCLWFVVLCCSVLGVAAGCGDTTVPGPVPVEGTITTEAGGPQVVYNKTTCNDNTDCKASELCTVDPDATKDVGYTIMVCKLSCDAKLETIEIDVANEDGTSFVASEVVKVEGTDTCQRLGDLTVYCDLEVRECKAYETSESPVVEPMPEEPTSESTEETSFALVRCCYDGDVAGLYGQIAWSTSASADPDSWAAARDLEFDWKGCFDSYVDLDKVTIGFWADVTTGIAEENKWVGSAQKPTTCLVDGESVAVGAFEPDYGWPLYDAAGD